MCLTADPGVEMSILTQSYTFVEIDHEILLQPLSDDSRRVVVSCKREYMHEVLVNHSVKIAQKKMCG